MAGFRSSTIMKRTLGLSDSLCAIDLKLHSSTRLRRGRLKRQRFGFIDSGGCHCKIIFFYNSVPHFSMLNDLTIKYTNGIDISANVNGKNQVPRSLKYPLAIRIV